MTRPAPSFSSPTLPRLMAPLLVAPLLMVALSSVACLQSEPAPAPLEKAAPVVESPPLPPGSYPIQSMAYDDADGAYRVFLLDAPPSHRGAFVSTQLRMARLTDEEIAAGKTATVEVDAEGPIAKLPTEFAIQYVHNVTEDVQSGGRNETVVVRQETSSWSPFMGAMAGMAIGSMLFRPMYYFPPPYMGGSMMGAGGYGASRMAAQQSFTSNHGSMPQSAKLSQSGYAKRPSSALKPTGSGAGSTRMNKPTTTSRPKGGFGGGFGGGGRRRR